MSICLAIGVASGVAQSVILIAYVIVCQSNLKADSHHAKSLNKLLLSVLVPILVCVISITLYHHVTHVHVMSVLLHKLLGETNTSIFQFWTQSNGFNS